jgi:hypothetical protein
MGKKGSKAKMIRIFQAMIVLGDSGLTSMEAVEEFKTTCLPSYIFKIKKRFSVEIETHMETSINSNGEEVRYARYKIPPLQLKALEERYKV